METEVEGPNQQNGLDVQQQFSNDMITDQNARTLSEEQSSRVTTEPNQRQMRRPS